MADENYPASAGTLDEEFQALQTDLGELGLHLLHRAEVAASGNSEESVRIQAESFIQKFAEALLESMVAAVYDHRFVSGVLALRLCAIRRLGHHPRSTITALWTSSPVVCYSCVAGPREILPASNPPCYSLLMAKSREPIRLARDIFDEFLSKADPKAVAENPPVDRTAQHKEAGRKGGLKGGKARAATLTALKKKIGKQNGLSPIDKKEG